MWDWESRNEILSLDLREDKQISQQLQHHAMFVEKYAQGLWKHEGRTLKSDRGKGKERFRENDA